MEGLNRLVLLADLVDIQPKKEEGYVLVAHNFPVQGDKWDLGFAYSLEVREPKLNVADGFYLIPVWQYTSFQGEEIYPRILSSAFGKKPFLRYFIQTKEHPSPILIEGEGVHFGPKEHNVLKLEEVLSDSPSTYEKIITLVKEKKINNFFEDY